MIKEPFETFIHRPFGSLIKEPFGSLTEGKLTFLTEEKIIFKANAKVKTMKTYILNLERKPVFYSVEDSSTNIKPLIRDNKTLFLLNQIYCQKL